MDPLAFRLAFCIELLFPAEFFECSEGCNARYLKHGKRDVRIVFCAADRADGLFFRFLEISFVGFSFDRIIEDRADVRFAQLLDRPPAFLYRLTAAELLEYGVFYQTLYRQTERQRKSRRSG